MDEKKFGRYEQTAQCQGNEMVLYTNGIRLGSVFDRTYTQCWIGVTLLTPDVPNAGVEIDYPTVSVP